MNKISKGFVFGVLFGAAAACGDGAGGSAEGVDARPPDALLTGSVGGDDAAGGGAEAGPLPGDAAEPDPAVDAPAAVADGGPGATDAGAADAGAVLVQDAATGGDDASQATADAADERDAAVAGTDAAATSDGPGAPDAAAAGPDAAGVGVDTADGGAVDVALGSDGAAPTDALVADAATSAEMSFFVTSVGNKTGDFGGLAGADRRCAELATAVGAGSKTWRAYLSVEKGASGAPENARDRIGKGPWHNAKGLLLAQNLETLHKRFGDETLFLDERGRPVPGYWAGSPPENEHDVLTGSTRDGRVKTGFTCNDWTSASAAHKGWVGHSDGLGPMGNLGDQYRPWNAIHENGGCHPEGVAKYYGGARIYCFAVAP